VSRLHPDFLRRNGLDKAQVFVETGTQGGVRVAKLRGMYQEIHTVELDPALHESAKSYLSKFPNVHCHLGSSPEVLPRIISDHDLTGKETVFFLDAHFVATSPSPGQVDNQCPVMRELDAIFAAAWRVRPVVLIDDAQLFWDWAWRRGRNKGYDRAQWPRYEEIEAKAKMHGYSVSFDGYVLILKVPNG
jgi:hypothetical protein